MKLFKNKKAQINDTLILLILASVFIGVGITIPFIQSAFPTDNQVIDNNNVSGLLKDYNTQKFANNSDEQTQVLGLKEGSLDNLGGNPFSDNTGTLGETVAKQTGGKNILSSFSVLQSIILMFFWSFSLPIWVDVIFLVFRIIFWYLVFKGLRGIGG